MNRSRLKKKVFLTVMLAGLLVLALFYGLWQQSIKKPAPRPRDLTIKKAATERLLPARLIENTEDHITLIDSYGNQVTLTKPIQSMLSQGMGEFYSAVKSLKAEDMLSTCTEYVKRNHIFFPAISQLPLISVGEVLDHELLIKLAPDFIHTLPYWYHYFNEAIITTTPIIQLDLKSTEDYRILGAIINREKEAEEFINWINSYINIIDQRIATLSENDFQAVFMYYGGQHGLSQPPPYGTFGKDNDLRNKLIRRAGGRSLSRNIAGDWIVVDSEWLIEQKPRLIIRECYITSDKPAMGYHVNDPARARALMHNIIQQPAFKTSPAVKNKRVHLISGELTTDSWFISLLYLAKWLHPALFPDIEPEKMHAEYITRFQRLDYDIYKQGVFAYSL